MTFQQKRQIEQLALQHNLTIDTGFGMIKIIDDIFKKISLENNQENRQIVAEIVVNQLIETVANLIEEESTYDLSMINFN